MLRWVNEEDRYILYVNQRYVGALYFRKYNYIEEYYFRGHERRELRFHADNITDAQRKVVKHLIEFYTQEVEGCERRLDCLKERLETLCRKDEADE